jgi:spore coat protein U-like protein
MKRVIVLGAAIALIAMAGVVAADTTSVTVSATVQGNCQFTSGGSVSFTLDPASGSDEPGLVTAPSFWCTKGTSYTITDDDGVNESGGSHRLKLAGLSEYIPYTFSYTPSGSGGGKGAPATLDLTSNIANGDYINASAGDYSDTVTLTITP